MSAAKEGFDRVFNLVGSCGPFQITLLLVVSLQCIILSWHHLSYIFLAAVPASFWCRIPELTESGWTESEIRNFSIPRTQDETHWESCLQYDLNYSYFSKFSYQQALLEVSHLFKNEVSVTTCSNGWEFDTSIYQSTLVTEFQLVCENRYLVAMIQATYMCGVFVGSLILGSLSDRIIGRRKSVLISVIMVQVGGLLAAFSTFYWELIVYRFLVAFGVAGAYQNCYVLLMEYTGTKSRSTMGMIQQLPFALGYMLMALYAYYIRDWQNLQLAFSITGIVLLSYFWMLPESARWLAVSGQAEESLEYLLEVADTNRKTVNPDEIMDIVKSCAEGKKGKPPLRTRTATFTIAPIDSADTNKFCLSPLLSCIQKVWSPMKYTLSIYMTLLATLEMRKRTLIIWYLFICVDLVYYGVVFDSATLTNDPYLLVFLGGLSEVPAYTVVVPFLSKWGRRPTIVLMFFATSFATLSVAYLPVEQEIIRTIVSMSGKLCITACFAVIYLLGTELYPTATRTTGLAAAVFMGRVGSILAPFVVDRMKSVYRDMPNIIFGIVCICSGLVSLLIPETKDLEMADQLCDVEDGFASGRKRNANTSPEVVQSQVQSHGSDINPNNGKNIAPDLIEEAKKCYQ